MDHIPYILTENGTVSLMVDGDMKTVNTSHINYHEIVEAIKESRFEDAIALMDVAKTISDYGAGQVEVRGGVVYYNGMALHNTLTTRMIKMREEGFNIDPLCRFLENLMQNPSKRSVDQLYSFLESGSMPITEDGHFLAYKIVRANYRDQHSGKFDNSPGKVIEVPRNQVAEDPDQTCAEGLHFCSQGYLGHYGSGRGSRVMIIKINPADVVAIPRDYNNAKGRCCRYEVLYEAKRAINSVDTEAEFTSSVWSSDEDADTSLVSAREEAGGYTTALFSMEEAANRLCGHCVYPMDALRKRIQRGSVTTEFFNGREMVRCPVEDHEVTNRNDAASDDLNSLDADDDPFGDDGNVW